MRSSLACEVSLTSSDHLAGDLVRATVSFRSPDREEVIDWAAVQVHGHSWHDPKLVSSLSGASSSSYSTSTGGVGGVSRTASTSSLQSLVPPTPSSSSSLSHKTAMPDMSTWVEGSTCLFATKPHCLCAELHVAPPSAADQSSPPVTYVVESRLPTQLPPSFRGTSARYGYLVTVCVKVRTEQFARVAHVPFYVAGTPQSLGDAARPGVPSLLFVERASGRRAPPSRRQSSSSFSDESPRGGAHAALPSQGGVVVDVNAFPRAYSLQEWEGEVRSSLADLRERMVWRMEPNENEDEEDDDAGSDDDGEDEEDGTGSEASEDEAAARPPSHSTTTTSKQFNVTMANRQRVARCTVSPTLLHPGDQCNIKLDFLPPTTTTTTLPRLSSVRVSIEVEESILGPPPLVSAFEPLQVKRTPPGPWVRTVSSRTVNVSLVQSTSVALSTLGAQANFSTDLVFVHAHLKLEFHYHHAAAAGSAVGAATVSTMRVPLAIRPPARASRRLSFCPSSSDYAAASPSSHALQRQSSLSSAGSVSSSSSSMLPPHRQHQIIARNHSDDQLPPATPRKKLVF